MPKIAIVSDTTMGLTFEEAKELNIHLISNGLSVAGNNYQEYVDMDTDTFLTVDSQSDIVPKTGAAAPGLTMEVMLEATKDSNDVLCLAMPSNYSGGINIRTMVANQLNEDYDSNIVVYDTPGLFSGATPFNREAARLRDQGKTIEEVIEGLDHMAQYASTHYAAEPYYLTENGRFQETMEELGMEKGDGQYVGIRIDNKNEVLWKASDASKAIDSLMADFDQAYQTAKADDVQLRVLITGNSNTEHETALEEALNEKYPEVDVEHRIMGPIASIHVGRGAFGLVWYPDYVD